MNRGLPTLMMLAGGVLGVAAVVNWWPHLDQGLLAAIAAAPSALLLHAVGALLFAIGCSRIYSRSMAPFFFVLAILLPLLGMLSVLGLNFVLGADPLISEEEEDLEYGNPILGRPAAGVAEVYPKPIARMMREVDAETIGQMILGLSKNGSADRGHQILRRFQQDNDVELQFYAQNAQSGATERLERHLKNLNVRQQSSPDDLAVNAALGEVLISLAGRRTTSSSDAYAYVRRAIDHLKQLPESAKRAALEVRAYLLLKEPVGASKALAKLAVDDLRRPKLEAEVLFAQREWKRLEACVANLESSDIQLCTARKFWKETA